MKKTHFRETGRTRYTPCGRDLKQDGWRLLKTNNWDKVTCANCLKLRK